MRLATVRFDGRSAPATVVEHADGRLAVHLLPGGVSVLDALAMTPQQRAELDTAAQASTPLPAGGYEFAPPVAARALRDFVAFEEHVVGVTRSVNGTADVPEAWYEAPAFLFMNPHSMIGAYDDLPAPPYTAALDFELEIAAVVTGACRDLTVEEAFEHIGGYCIVNDWSARDLQKREMQVGLGPSKGKDFAATVGPWITTADELRDFHRDGVLDLAMEVEVSGVRVGADRSGNMAWSFAELLAHASRDAWVGDGDIIASGTCHTGALAETWGRIGRQEPPPLRPGDLVTMRIEGLGTLANTVVGARSPGHRVPQARRHATPSRAATDESQRLAGSTR